MANRIPAILLILGLMLTAPAAAREPAETAKSAGLAAVLARAAARSGQWESAARLWRQRTIAAPMDAEGWAGLGEALSRTGEGADAVAALARAEELAPGRPGLALLLGRAQLQQGNARAALAAFTAATDANPRNPAGWTGLGIAHDLLDEPTEAQIAYGRALGIDPLNAAARHNLALSRSRQAAAQPGAAP
jgi:Flp pilus assembly protein TadD